MVANWIPLIMQGASDTMSIFNKLFGGGGSSYNSDSAKAAKWQHTYNLAAMKQAQKYTLDQMAKTYNYNAKGVAQQYKYNLALQKQAQNYDTSMYNQRYQMQVEDLKKAGINPLYGLGTAPAITAGANSVGAPTTGGGMNPLGSGLADLAGENNSKRMFKLEKVKAVADMIQKYHQNSALAAETKLNEQKTKTEEWETLFKKEQQETQKVETAIKKLEEINKKNENDYLSKWRKQDLKNQITQGKKLIAEIRQAITGSMVNEAQIANTKADTAKKKAEKEKIMNDTENTEIFSGTTLAGLKFGINWHPNRQSSYVTVNGKVNPKAKSPVNNFANKKTNPIFNPSYGSYR